METVSVSTEEHDRKERSRLKAETFKRLALDSDVPHGAVRLFLVLNTFANKRNECWPGQRKIQNLLRCSTGSLKPWTAALVKGGYLTTKSVTTRKGLLTLYALDFSGVLPKPATPGVAKTGNGTVVQDYSVHRKTLRKTGGLHPPSPIPFLHRTNSAPRKEFQARPDNVSDVVIHSLKAHHCSTKNIQAILDYYGSFDALPASDIVTAIADEECWAGDWTTECCALQLAFRFVRLNNRKNWQSSTPWCARFNGFKERCEEDSQGPVETPRDWYAVIADERPDDQKTL